MSLAFGIQHAMRMPHITVSSAVCPAVPYISTSFQERQDFRKRKIENNVGVLILS